MTAELSTTDVVSRTAKPILEIGRAWMMDPATAERGAALGITGAFGFWTNGRAGVLGDVSADMAAAAIGFMSPVQIASFWNARPTNVSPRDSSLAYAEAAARWGRQAFADVDDTTVERANAAAQKVIGAALPSTGMLFAGWRELPVPDDPRGAVTHSLQVLRELRGCAHLSAVQAAGIGPLGSIMSTDDPVRGGAAWADRFGWREPYPEPDTIRRAQAEAMTTTACEHAYAILSPSEGAAFVDDVTALRNVID